MPALGTKSSFQFCSGSHSTIEGYGATTTGQGAQPLEDDSFVIFGRPLM
jgi:hypothetical protein